MDGRKVRDAVQCGSDAHTARGRVRMKYLMQCSMVMTHTLCEDDCAWKGFDNADETLVICTRCESMSCVQGAGAPSMGQGCAQVGPSM